MCSFFYKEKKKITVLPFHRPLNLRAVVLWCWWCAGPSSHLSHFLSLTPTVKETWTLTVIIYFFASGQNGTNLIPLLRNMKNFFFYFPPLFGIFVWFCLWLAKKPCPEAIILAYWGSWLGFLYPGNISFGPAGVLWGSLSKCKDLKSLECCKVVSFIFTISAYALHLIRGWITQSCFILFYFICTNHPSGRYCLIKGSIDFELICKYFQLNLNMHFGFVT